MKSLLLSIVLMAFAYAGSIDVKPVDADNGELKAEVKVMTVEKRQLQGSNNPVKNAGRKPKTKKPTKKPAVTAAPVKPGKKKAGQSCC